MHTSADQSGSLVLAALGVLCLSFIIYRTYLSRVQACTIALVKTAVPFLYFAYFFDGSWTLLDDWNYLDRGHAALGGGYGPVSALFHADYWQELQSATGSTNIFYYWWNSLAESLFGYHYWAPIWLNVAATSLTGLMTFMLAKRLGYSRRQSRRIAIFAVLQWEFLVWTSFINIKDGLAALVSVAFLCGVVAIATRQRPPRDQRGNSRKRPWPTMTIWWSLLGLSAVVGVALRFYLLALLIVALAVWMLLELKAKYALSATLAGALGFVLFARRFQDAAQHIHLGELGYGLVHFLFTPVPWQVESAYSFLLIPSILNWFWMPFVFYGVWALWMRSHVARLIVIYCGVVVVFYAVVPMLQGPRQRMQIIPLLAIFAYEGFRRVLSGKSSRSRCARYGVYSTSPISS